MSHESSVSRQLFVMQSSLVDRDGKPRRAGGETYLVQRLHRREPPPAESRTIFGISKVALLRAAIAALTN
jgi:hypothetical protein